MCEEEDTSHFYFFYFLKNACFRIPSTLKQNADYFVKIALLMELQ